MTVNKFIRKLLNLKGLFVTNYQFKIRDRVLNLWVKPHKNGCLCPYCKRRGRILLIADTARNREIFLSAGGLFSFGTVQESLYALPMAEYKKIYPGLMPMPV